MIRTPIAIEIVVFFSSILIHLFKSELMVSFVAVKSNFPRSENLTTIVNKFEAEEDVCRYSTFSLR